MEQTHRISLNGEHLLYSYPHEEAPLDPNHLSGKPILAEVPGNVVLDYMRNGLLPDVYHGHSNEEAKKLERLDFWYVRKFPFQSKKGNGEYRLVFDAVDTFAEYFLNGKKIGDSDNAFIPHSFLVNEVLQNGENTLSVHLFSTHYEAEKHFGKPGGLPTFPQCQESLWIRNPAHSYGWDDLPRCLGTGIWRGVSLEWVPPTHIEDVYLSTCGVYPDVAVLRCAVNAKLEEKYIGDCRLKIEGACEDSHFEAEYPFLFQGAVVFPYVKNPSLWHPNGYGKPNLYDIVISILHEGEVIAEKKLRFGIRELRLLANGKQGKEGKFEFRLNGELLRIRGFNWTPLDILHSKDASKVEESLQAFHDMHGNMLRVWGGGVYEDDAFFDLCDELGILVWQDAMFACHGYPQDEEFLAKVKEEAEAIAKKIRNHPSLALWCGSNETDWNYVCTGMDPAKDKITREVLPDAFYQNDPERPYYISTPWFSPDYMEKHGGYFYLDLKVIEEQRKELPEEHFWWHRLDFRAILEQEHKFIAETGYPSSSEAKVIDKYLGRDVNLESLKGWEPHAYGVDKKMMEGSEYLFHDIPKDREEEILASQFYQAEAFQLCVESMRVLPERTGILFWQWVDGYPMFSFGVLDYELNRKEAYYRLRDAFEPVQCIVSEDEDEAVGYLVNDTPDEAKGFLKVTDEEGNLVYEGEVSLQAGETKKELFRVPYVNGKFLFSELNLGDKVVKNKKCLFRHPVDYLSYKKAMWEKR